MSSFTSTTHRITATDEDRALKAKHAAMWASGSYATVVDEVVHTLGGVLVDALDVSPASASWTSPPEPARRRSPRLGAAPRSSATDLTPELLAVGRAAAEAEGIELTWQTADAEALPFADADFDVVMSSIGVMFAPHHAAGGRRARPRVPSRAARIGVLSWTPNGFIGQLFATMKPYAPPPPPGASPAPLWGSVDARARALRRPGRRGRRPSSARCGSTASRRAPSSATSSRPNYGPTIAVYRFIADDAAKVAALDADMAALGDRFLRDGVMPWEYLIVTAKRR